jgi:putative DNA primase/helicase
MDALHPARSEADVPVSPSKLNANAWLLNCKNGTVDLRTGELLRHRLADLLTKMATVDYDPQADAHAFTKLLERILPSEALWRFVQRVVSYAHWRGL